VRAPLTDRDPGDEQAQLFEPPAKCGHKGCPSKASLCKHEADIAHGIIDRFSRRPRSCLNAYDPKTAPLPEGY
jgi:hypothetical protein